MMDLAAVVNHLIVNGTAVQGDNICVVNSAWFVLGFYFDDLVNGSSCPEISHYPIDQTECYSISDKLPSANAGDLVQLEVHAHAGETKAGDSAIVYTPGAPTVTFNCTGTTFNFSCKVLGQETEVLGDETEAVAVLLAETKF